MSSAGDKTKPKLISQKVDASYYVVITCDVEVDLSDPELNVEFPLAKVPFAGDWRVAFNRRGDKPWVELRYGVGEQGRVGSHVQLKLDFFTLRNGVEHLVEHAYWQRKAFPGSDAQGTPYARSDSVLECAKVDVNGQQQYRLRFTFDQQAPGLTVPPDGPATLANRVADLHLEQVPSQLRLFFPEVGKDGAELWVSRDLLAKSAPYFKDLLYSEFSEAIPRSRRARQNGAQPLPAPTAVEQHFDDSDDETDAFLLEHKPPKLSESNEANELSFREIAMTQASFSTYHALLVYLETGYVRFAPLRSACSPSNPSASSSRDDFLSKQLQDNPSLPLPISPKSMYRLVDLLRLPDSDTLFPTCLRALSDSLTHHGAAGELFGETSVCFDKIRKVVLEYVVENWDAVSETTSWKEKTDHIQAGEMPEAAPILLELIKTQQEANKQKLAEMAKA